MSSKPASHKAFGRYLHVQTIKQKIVLATSHSLCMQSQLPFKLKETVFSVYIIFLEDWFRYQRMLVRPSKKQVKIFLKVNTMTLGSITSKRALPKPSQMFAFIGCCYFGFKLSAGSRSVILDSQFQQKMYTGRSLCTGEIGLENTSCRKIINMLN